MIWVQLVGLLALLLDISSVQFRLRKHILMVQIIASFTWAMHFLLLGAITGSAMNLVGVVRSISYFVFKDSKRNVLVPASIVLLSAVATTLVWQGYVSLLPMFAMMIAAIAFWQLDEQKIRVLLLLAAPLWFIYNYIFESYAGMLSDAIATISLVIALYRYRSKPDLGLVKSIFR